MTGPLPDDPATPGPIVFARYAYGPNRLGYCGPDDADELLEATASGNDRVARGLAERFEGAYPYLALIARSNGVPDPLDRRVVEAYWLGSDLLDAVPAGAFGASLDERFRARVPAKEWRWLGAKPMDDARPVHAFHVLDVFPRVGLLRGGPADDMVGIMDACRIRWGRVIDVIDDQLVVSSVPLELVDGKLRLGDARPERVQAWRGSTGFLDGVRRGDVVSIHWSWACDRLEPRQLANLVTWTQRQVRVANQTL